MTFEAGEKSERQSPEVPGVPSITVERPAPRLNAFGRWLMRVVLKIGLTHDTPQFRAAAEGRETYEETYTGRLLSYLEWLEFEPVFAWLNGQRQKASRGELSEEELRDLVTHSASMYRRYLQVTGIPWREVFKLPPKEFSEKMSEFFRYQVAADLATPDPDQPEAGSRG